MLNLSKSLNIQGRRLFATMNKHVCVVGSGPSAFYTTKYLLRDIPEVKVDMVEMLPVPFGLVRRGVAPDHPEVRNVQNDFTNVVETNQDRFRFFGNTTVGKDIDLKAIQENYDAVVLGHGCATEHLPGIENGEKLSHIVSANKFVDWYNVYPQSSEASASSSYNLLKDAKHVVVIGQGNVALDIARLCVSPVSDLHATDIGLAFTRAVETSSLQSITILGRRGPLEVAFTNKELREMTTLPGAICEIDPAELEDAKAYDYAKEVLGNRAHKRAFQLMEKLADNWEVDAETASPRVRIRFFGSPIRAIANPANPDRIGSVECELTKLEVHPATTPGGEPVTKAVPTGKTFTIPCDLLIYSVGFWPTPLPGVSTKGRGIPNEEGKVLPSALEHGDRDNVFVTGWIKRGGRGNIATSVPDAQETAANVRKYLDNAANANNLLDSKHNANLLPEASAGKVVSWAGWESIDKAERDAAAALPTPGKPKVRFETLPEMVAAAKKN